jgi:hypothetical protein
MQKPILKSITKRQSCVEICVQGCVWDFDFVDKKCDFKQNPRKQTVCELHS